MAALAIRRDTQPNLPRQKRHSRAEKHRRRGAWPSLAQARDRRVINHLHGITRWILTIKTACAVAMATRLGFYQHAMLLQKIMPNIDLFRFGDDKADVIEPLCAGVIVANAGVGAAV